MRQKLPAAPSRALLRHPGAEVSPRRSFVNCLARPDTLRLKAGESLLAGVSREMDRLGHDGAVLTLDGLGLADCNFVIPAGPRDPSHAAWYSETCSCRDARLDHATAMVGKRDGAWFVHCHALWDQHTARPSMGHLLCDQVVIADDYDAPARVLTGGRLEVALDPETNFPLFRPVLLDAISAPNAALLTIRPHSDLRSTLEEVCAELGYVNARVMGIGSLIGAEFAAGPAMHSPISEVLLLDDAGIRSGECTGLPVVCVDPDRATFEGDLLRNCGPVCVTFELLIFDEASSGRPLDRMNRTVRPGRTA